MASAKRTPSLGAARIADDVDLTIMAPCSLASEGARSRDGVFCFFRLALDHRLVLSP